VARAGGLARLARPALRLLRQASGLSASGTAPPRSPANPFRARWARGGRSRCPRRRGW
jgi:hypothetical protein